MRAPDRRLQKDARAAPACSHGSSTGWLRVANPRSGGGRHGARARGHEAQHASAAGATGGAKIYRFLSRPQFAIAAAVLLVLGAATLFVNMPAKRATDSVAQAPAAVEVAASATAVATTTAPAEPESQASALALATPPPAPMTAPTVVAKAKAAGGGGGTLNGPSDPAFVAAKTLFDAGRYAEALPKFDAMAASNPEAELYAARCVARLKDVPPLPLVMTAWRERVGTESGSRASLDRSVLQECGPSERCAFALPGPEDRRVRGEGSQRRPRCPRYVQGVGGPAKAPPAATASVNIMK